MGLGLDIDFLKVGAFVLTAMWVASALLALSGDQQRGAVFNALVSAAIGGSALPSLGARIINHQEYVERYGAAAQQQFPLALSVLALSLVGVATSLAALKRSLGPFVIGWFVNAPMIAFALYVAFWFQQY